MSSSPPGAAPYLVGRAQDAILLVWTKSPSVAGIEALAAQFAAAVREHPNRKLVFLTIVEETASKPPDGLARVALSDLLTKHDHRIAAGAIVFEATGFGASVVRSVVATIAATQRRTFPYAVFKSIEDATQWAEQQAPQTTADSLTRAITKLRGR